MKKSTKLLAALLSLLMLCSVLPMSVFAADTHTVRYVLNYNGAPKMESKTVADGETAPYVDGSVRDGWFFSGWSLRLFHARNGGYHPVRAVDAG